MLLEVPRDVAMEEAEEPDLDYEPPMVMRTAPDPDALRRAAQALLAASNPIIHAGQGVLYSEATEELVRVAEFLQAPVMTTLAGKSAFPENHPLSVGAAGPSTTLGVHRYLGGADLVFGIGCSFTKTSFGVSIPPGKTMVHSTNDDGDINKEYKCQYPLLGDSKLVLTQLLDELKRQTNSDGRSTNQALVDGIRSTKQEWLDQWMPRLTSNEVPINPYRVVWDLMHTVDLDNVIVTHESGSAREYVVPVLGSHGSRVPSSAGASPPSWATAWVWQWARRWRRRKSRLSTLWATSPSARWGWTSRLPSAPRFPLSPLS